MSKPSQPGSSQNHSAKNATPTANEATVVSQAGPLDSVEGSLVISSCLGRSMSREQVTDKTKICAQIRWSDYLPRPSLVAPTSRAL